MNEYIYILSNPSMRGLIKVGKTTTHPSQRMSELHSTGVPAPFELEVSVMVRDCGYSETQAHRVLSRYRVSENREFFRVSVKKALQLILPEIGECQIHDFKETHDIDQILQEADRRERKTREAEAARQQEVSRTEADRLAKRRAIEQRITAEENKLRQLGQRPIPKELKGTFLAMCYYPLPIGWIIWIGAVSVLDAKSRTVGLVCIALLVAGYIYSEINKKHRAAFDKINAPFREIDNSLIELRRELAKLPISESARKRSEIGLEESPKNSYPNANETPMQGCERSAAAWMPKVGSSVAGPTPTTRTCRSDALEQADGMKVQAGRPSPPLVPMPSDTEIASAEAEFIAKGWDVRNDGYQRTLSKGAKGFSCYTKQDLIKRLYDLRSGRLERE